MPFDTNGKRLLLSVIVPAFQAERWLQECPNSLHRCGVQGPKIIVVDDASTDGTAAVARAWQRSHGRVQLIQTGHQGPGCAPNAGVDQARGQFLAFVDADDVIPPRCFRVLAVGGRTGQGRRRAGADAAVRRGSARAAGVSRFQVASVGSRGLERATGLAGGYRCNSEGVPLRILAGCPVGVSRVGLLRGHAGLVAGSPALTPGKPFSWMRVSLEAHAGFDYEGRER